LILCASFRYSLLIPGRFLVESQFDIRAWILSPAP
jgi:hypothetical protein